MTDQQNLDNLAIAVIGMAGKFPGANDLDSFWENLCNGVESIRHFTTEELLSVGISEKIVGDSHYVAAKGVLSDIDLFDADFFGVNPHEAELMDPQHRLFLETAWTALENSGYDPQRYDGWIGVYAGSGNTTYLNHVLQDSEDLNLRAGQTHVFFGNYPDFFASRVAYKLGLKGPAVVVRTACSTSLVAINMACQSLLNYQCDMALAGGCSIHVPEKAGYVYEKGGILSPDGQCMAFDERAAGTVPGDGVGILVLKRLNDALQDQDNILAIIRGFALNNDGSDKVGYTAPSVDGQAEVISLAHEMAGGDFEAVAYVEAHGTATPLGDPVEVAALTQAFRQNTQKTNFCAVGSVKTNIGHLDAAAGVASVIKTILSLRHGLLLPSLHFQTPNPKIDFSNSPFYVNTTLKEWPNQDKPRRAGVSSFGMGGTNAHLVLEAAPSRNSESQADTFQVLPLSAKTPEALEQLTNNLADYLTSHPDICLNDVAYTLQVGRSQHSCRQAIICRTHSEAIEALRGVRVNQVNLLLKDNVRQPIFLFHGLGTTNLEFVRKLYAGEPVFTQELDRCFQVLKPYYKYDLHQILSSSVLEPELPLHLVNTQPICLAVAYALAKLLQSLGIEPTGVLGFGLGKYICASIAGVMTIEDALMLIAKQSQEVANDTPFTEQLTTLLQTVSLQSPQISLFDPVAGDWIDKTELVNPEYWVRQLKQQAPVSKLTLDSEYLLLELEPGRILDSQIASENSETIINVYRTIESAPNNRKPIFQALLHIWLAGGHIDWQQLHLGTTPRRVALPTYPFQRQRYWYEPRQNVRVATRPAPVLKQLPPIPLKKKKNLAEWFYVPQWRRTLPLLPFNSLNLTGSQNIWLLFLDDCGVGQSFAQHLQSLGINVFTVSRSTDFQVLSECNYTINPTEAEHYGLLLDDLAQRNKIPSHILNFWFVTSLSDELAPETGFEMLLFLAQALGKCDRSFTTHLTIVSTNLHVIEPSDRICPAKATLLGPCRVIPLEYANITCRSLDIELPKNETETARLLDSLFCESTVLNEEPIVAYRGESRLILEYEQKQLTPDDGNENIPLQEHGVYVIAGGLGGVGLSLATFLAEEYSAKIALITRSPFPPRESWHDLLTQSHICDFRTYLENLSAAESVWSEKLAIASLSDYPGLESGLLELCRCYALDYLKGALRKSKTVTGIDTQKLLECLEVSPSMERFIEFMIDLLQEQEVLIKQNGRLHFGPNFNQLQDSSHLSASLRANYPAFTGIIDVLERAATHYHEALSGKIPAISVLYPEGRSDFLEQATKNTLEYSQEPIYRRVLAELVRMLAYQQEKQPLRILEVGAGSGLLTQVVAKELSQLTSQKVEYWVTDISPSFMEQLQHRIADNGFDFIQTRVFDISRDPITQGYAPGSFDVILALNVVHATPNIENTLFNLRSLLAPNGILALIEATKMPPWIDMIWGLSKGWWQFEDTHLRNRSPLLSQHNWEKLLTEQGFTTVESLPANAEMQSTTDTALIIAQISREQVAASPSWNSEANPQELTQHRIRRIQEIELRGGEVEIYNCDICDRDALAATIVDIEQRFGSINGVIQSAMVLDDGLMQLETSKKAMEVLRPKIQGTQLLFELTNNPKRSFFAISSSLASTLGLYAQADYCAANAFQDAFAQKMNTESESFVCSINWGNWSDAGAAMRLLMDKSSVAPRLHWVPHPLFDHCVETIPGRRVYHARLSVQRHWIVNEHRLDERPLVPGTAFLELARAAYQHWNPSKAVELRDVLFLNTLEVHESQDREVRVVLEDRGDYCNFTILSQDDASYWYENARGEIAVLQNYQPTLYDIQALRRACQEKRVADTGLTSTRDNIKHFGPVSVGPRWYKAITDRYFGQNQAMAELTLPEDYSDDLYYYKLHPALLDVATSFAIAAQDFYFPFSYKKLRLYGSLPSKIVAYARYLDDGRSGKETISFDILLLDEAGHECALIEGFMLKSSPERYTNKAISPVASPDLHPELQQGMSSPEGAEAFRHILRQSSPQVLVSTQDFASVQAENKTMRVLRFKENALPLLREFTTSHSLDNGNYSTGKSQLHSTTINNSSGDHRQGLTSPLAEDMTVLVNIFREVLRIQQIKISDDFFDLNGDSLQAIMVTSRIREIFGVELGPDALFDCPTPEKLLQSIKQKLTQVKSVFK
ncbi:beta-ketoacyl synthase N-terminal-like domain-containing protein [Nostoc sp. UIC 10607]|uniref:beta-ketoacyl synthase N-terminal-like domain-containing protein n=1 Tax=Nostoc sp. UIC 10607 TaxID=3045935 RepID=UPI0039A04147